MRIELPHRSERFGAVRIHGVQEVWELDSGGEPASVDDNAWHSIHHVPSTTINDYERRMAIVVPVKGERLKVLDGVLSGIPHD